MIATLSPAVRAAAPRDACSLSWRSPWRCCWQAPEGRRQAATSAWGQPQLRHQGRPRPDEEEQGLRERRGELRRQGANCVCKVEIGAAGLSPPRPPPRRASSEARRCCPPSRPSLSPLSPPRQPWRRFRNGDAAVTDPAPPVPTRRASSFDHHVSTRHRSRLARAPESLALPPTAAWSQTLLFPQAVVDRRRALGERSGHPRGCVTTSSRWPPVAEGRSRGRASSQGGPAVDIVRPPPRARGDIR